MLLLSEARNRTFLYYPSLMKTRALLSVITGVFLIMATLQGQSNENQEKTIQKIDSYLSQGAAHGFSGSVLLAREGEVLLHKGYGLADKEQSIAYTPYTVSTIGSVTKQFTATAILKLEEMQMLTITDSLGIFFKDIPQDKQAITIHQLLTHTSGLVNAIGSDFEDIPVDKFFKAVFATELLHSPGAQYAYSNIGYSILARIIEVVSGSDYEKFLQKHLFLPAEMKQTGYLLPKWEKVPVAKGYAYNLVFMGTLLSRFEQQDGVTWSLKGNGGIHSTTGDMYKWYRALKNHKVLSKESFEKLTTPYVLEYEGGDSYYGYGWALYTSDRNTKIISHNGGNGVFFHDYLYLPQEDVVIILFTNASSREVEVAWPLEKMLFDGSCDPGPIRHNLFYKVVDFIQSHSIDKSEALETLLKVEYAQTLESSAPLNHLAYRILNNDIVELEAHKEWALQLFLLNAQLHPNDGNVWDSLGEGYLRNGVRAEAKRSYQKALSLGGDGKCDWCESSRKALKKLNDLE